MNKTEKKAIEIISHYYNYISGDYIIETELDESIADVIDLLERWQKEIKVNNLMFKLKDKKLNEYKGSVPRNKIIELLNKNSKFSFISKADIEKLLNE